ncbi:hypothetical protein RAA17_01640 [Komagataeibacter rhaeticus]|nr:hypothetical protein [Komagataeibacter rhaeticus]
MTASPKMIEAVAKEYHAPMSAMRGEWRLHHGTRHPDRDHVPTGRYEGSLPATATAAEITARMTELMNAQGGH